MRGCSVGWGGGADGLQAGNDKYDAERAERQEREKAGAQVKLEELEQKVLEEVNQVPKRQAVAEQKLEIQEILADLMQEDLEIFDSKI